MPNIREKWDSKLIDLFLSVYDGGTWAGSLSATDRPESRVDRAVEVVATRKSDGLQLAIEHTLIEPFVGDKSDYHGHFKSVQQRLRADASLRLPGFALFLDLPVGALPRKSDWQSIADEIGAWLRTEHASFTDRIGERPCPCLHHPSLELMVQVRKMPLGDRARSFPVIVARYGDPHLDESVDKALRNKLSKLVETPADRRLLLLERDNGWLGPKDILAEVERRRQAFPELKHVDEIWIADTASFEEKGRYVAFGYSGPSGVDSWTFEFYDGSLLMASKNGMAVPADLPTHTPPLGRAAPPLPP